MSGSFGGYRLRFVSVMGILTPIQYMECEMTTPSSQNHTRWAEAPWQLSGRGFILLGRFDPEWVRQQCTFQPEFGAAFKGGWGAMMLVDYHHSDVGPYQECLWIPGRYDVNGARRFHIPQIYVSTDVSVRNGRKNWGIPKRQARFDWQRDSSHERIQISAGNAVSDVILKTHPLYLPFSTALLPRCLRTIVQNGLEGGFLSTLLSGYGIAQWASVESIEIDPSMMAPIEKNQIHMALCISRFKLTFHEPQWSKNLAK